MRRAFATVTILAVGCNAILGIEDRHARPDDGVEGGPPDVDVPEDGVTTQPAPTVDAGIESGKFSLSAPPVILSSPGKVTVDVVVTRKEGFADPIVVTFANLPLNVGTSMQTEHGEGKVPLTIEAPAPPAVSHLGPVIDAVLLGTSGSERASPKTPVTIDRHVWSRPTVNNWTNTAAVSKVTVEAWGAGGGIFQAQGGAGAYARADVAVVQGGTYFIVVGSPGTILLGDAGGPYGGGARNVSGAAGYGGGYSGFFEGSTAIQANALVIGGGGGGASGNLANGGGAGGQNGAGVLGGKAGSSTTAGGGGGGNATSGTKLLGGNGGTPGGGNGGGGYYGGGGGGGQDAGVAPGGGGGGGSLAKGDNPSIQPGDGPAPGNAQDQTRTDLGAAVPEGAGLVVVRLP